MKIKVREISYEELLKKTRPEHVPPKKQSAWVRLLLKTMAKLELSATDFTFEKVGMDKLPSDCPCLILMNHSSFTDLSMAAALLADRPYHIVCTNDGFIGKEKLMRTLGCVSTKKFTTDLMLLKDMRYVFNELKESILMYPEASYSFDGTATVLPSSLGKCLKMMKVPVVMIKAEGSFLRDPLYNNLQKRKVKTSAVMTYLLSPEEIAQKSVDELNAIIRSQFSFDYFRHQYEHGISVSEPFRADHLDRVLYHCPHCLREGQMQGKGVHITCNSCGKKYELLEDGRLSACDGDSRFTFATDWYAWEREQVKKEIVEGSYYMEVSVDICALYDHDSLYRIGEGILVHDPNGFHLTGCDGRLDYRQSVSASYSLYADYYWYELGDVIIVGDEKMQFVCFPKDQEAISVAKARLAAEEMFKLADERRKARKRDRRNKNEINPEKAEK